MRFLNVIIIVQFSLTAGALSECFCWQQVRMCNIYMQSVAHKLPASVCTHLHMVRLSLCVHCVYNVQWMWQWWCYVPLCQIIFIHILPKEKRNIVWTLNIYAICARAFACQTFIYSKIRTCLLLSLEFCHYSRIHYHLFVHFFAWPLYYFLLGIFGVF